MDLPLNIIGHYNTSFLLELCCKDLRLLDQLGTQTEMDLTRLAREKFDQERQEFGDDAAELLVCKRVENASDTNINIDGDWVKHWEA
jgi:hypothetical protein